MLWPFPRVSKLFSNASVIGVVLRKTAYRSDRADQGVSRAHQFHVEHGGFRSFSTQDRQPGRNNSVPIETELKLVLVGRVVVWGLWLREGKCNVSIDPEFGAVRSKNVVPLGSLLHVSWDGSKKSGKRASEGWEVCENGWVREWLRMAAREI
jgi:hypothetical protein